MSENSSIFAQTYQGYLKRLKQINLAAVANELGASYADGRVRVLLLDQEYTVSREGIQDQRGQKPGHDICVILSQYLLLCPDSVAARDQWVRYRNFKNGAPLRAYFTTEVEAAIGSYFSQKLELLRHISSEFGGFSPEISVKYDYAMQLNLLPKVPVIVLVNDADELFQAHCSVLFKEETERYLDCESIAMLGRHLYSRIVQCAETSKDREPV